MRVILIAPVLIAITVSAPVHGRTSSESRAPEAVYYANAYTDRLNEVFTPASWTRIYNVTALSPVTRMKRDKAI